MTSTDTTAAVLAERYGAPRPWRGRVLLGVVGAVVLAFAAWLVWATLAEANPSVTSQLLSFDVSHDSVVTAQVQVQVNGDTDATCTVDAYASDHTLVGQVDFHPQAIPGPQTYTETIHTERQATSVDLLGCTAPGQPRPR